MDGSLVALVLLFFSGGGGEGGRLQCEGTVFNHNLCTHFHDSPTDEVYDRLFRIQNVVQN